MYIQSDLENNIYKISKRNFLDDYAHYVSNEVDMTLSGKYLYKYPKFTIDYSDLAPVDGKRKYINKSGFKTKAEAIEEGNKAMTEYLNAGVPFKESKISYSDYLDYWLDNYCRKNLKYNTIQAYSNIIKNHIKPSLGMYRLSNLTSVKLNSFITNICDRNSFSKSYFKNILKVLKGSFRDATNLYGFIKYNPALTLRLPRIEQETEDVKHLYTKDEIERILRRFSNDDAFTCAFLTSCFTGMRTGEVCALTWNDIDLENGTISISHNVYDKPKDEKGRWYIGTTKTLTGKRKIHISNTLLIALKNYKKKQAYCKKAYGNSYNYYHLEDATNEYGKVVEHRIVKNEENIVSINTLNLVFTKENGIYNGTEIRDVADILGHRNIETTENYYISSTSETRKAANDSFDKMMSSDVIDMVSRFSI